MSELTAKQKLFVVEYLKDFNGAQAAVRANYSKKTARSQGSRLLTNVDIQNALREEMEGRIERVKIDSDFVLQQHKDILKMNISQIINDDWTVKPLNEWPKIWLRMINGLDVSEIFEGSGDQKTLIGYLKKMKWPDKLKNLELLGRHVDIQAYREKSEGERILKVYISPQDAKL